jgi:hypothetical protein
MRGQIVVAPDTNGDWVEVSSNYSVSVSGSGQTSGPNGSSSWSWVEFNPNDSPNDGAVVDVEFDGNNSLNPFDLGWAVVSVEAPGVGPSPANAQTLVGVLGDAPFPLPSVNLTVPSDNGPFSVSGSVSTNAFGYPIIGDGISETATGSFSYTVSYQPPSTNLTLVSVQTPAAVNGNQHTFISTDTITVNASVGGGKVNIPVTWTVTSLNGASPSMVASGTVNSGPGGISTFSFSPADSGALVQFRQTQFKNASKTPNLPLSFEVVAAAQGNKVSLSQSSAGTLMQDETDTMRQEYVDFQLNVPDRSEIVPTIDDGTGNQYNVGNYGVMVSEALPDHFTAILAAYRAQTTVVNGATVGIPANASVIIKSGFRNPRRNVYAGSKHNTQGDISRHVLGSAFDLVPSSPDVFINNKRVRLGLHANLFPALCAATASLGLHTLPEVGCCTIVPCGTTEDHTHVDW